MLASKEWYAVVHKGKKELCNNCISQCHFWLMTLFKTLKVFWVFLYKEIHIYCIIIYFFFYVMRTFWIFKKYKFNKFRRILKRYELIISNLSTIFTVWKHLFKDKKFNFSHLPFLFLWWKNMIQIKVMKIKLGENIEGFFIIHNSC